jgi:hypothetical protein
MRLIGHRDKEKFQNNIKKLK